MQKLAAHDISFVLEIHMVTKVIKSFSMVLRKPKILRDLLLLL